MGYQESIIYLTDDKKYVELANQIKERSASWSESIYFIKTLELLEDIEVETYSLSDINEDFTIKKGFKLIHIGGERHLQRDIKLLFGDDVLEEIKILPAECFAESGIFYKEFENEVFKVDSCIEFSI